MSFSLDKSFYLMKKAREQAPPGNDMDTRLDEVFT